MTAPAFETLAIHGGLGPDPATGAILTPIYQTTTYVQDAVGVHKGYTYSRSENPTVAALERNLGALEGALPAVAFGTGLSAIATLVLATCRQGDRILVSEVVYGGTVRLLRQLLSGFGLETELVDTSDAAALRSALRMRARLVLVESPGNPTLVLTDLRAAAAACREAGALFAVDNTLLTPALQRPLELGADVSVYSTTKYIEGHNATLGGALTTRDPELAERLRFVRKTLGTIQSPFEAWLTLRGIKTLRPRMELHSRGALEVARFLEAHPAVERVTYPGLASFPQGELARRQQAGSGGIVAFELRGGSAAGRRLLETLELCALAENLGAAETLVTHPATMTHASLSPEERQRLGITDGLVRLSVGLEAPADVIADLEQALRAAEA